MLPRINGMISLQNFLIFLTMTDSIFIARKNVWLRSIANTCQCILETPNHDINFEFFLRLNRALIIKGIEKNRDVHEEFMRSRKYQCVPSYRALCKNFFNVFIKMKKDAHIRVLYKCMYAICDYGGCEFPVDSFNLQEFEDIRFDSDIYFEKFPEFNRANLNVMHFGPNYKNAYKWTNHWDDDHKDDADI
jgi:hypothetical protein